MTDENAQQEFNTQIGVIKAVLSTKPEIRFYREDEDQPYRREDFELFEEADNEFFSLDSQIIEKFYLPEEKMHYTVETVVHHTVEAENHEEAINKVGEMDGESFMQQMESPESIVTEIQEG